MKKVNLNDLAHQVTLMEGLNSEQSVAQIKETIALLGIRWRSLSEEEALDEFRNIRERAGSSSEHE